ncbi:MAG: hypothetical protein NVSMB17_14780 [Candidatus Dormibacteria bacterium]
MLVVWRGGEWIGGTIMETEAYLGAADEASHSRGGPTPRSAPMFGPPGMAYVYLVYGMYHCLNAVTEPEGEGAAVLIRALAPLVPHGSSARPLAVPAARLRGPGLLCRELGVTREFNGYDLVSGSQVRICPGPPVEDGRVAVGPRVGINRSRELPLRFRVVP